MAYYPPDTIFPQDDMVLCSGIARMDTPVGGAHARSVGIRIPFTFSELPAVTGTVFVATGKVIAGTSFAIWHIDINLHPAHYDPNQAEIVVHAATISGQEVDVDAEVVFHYVIIGKMA